MSLPISQRARASRRRLTTLYHDATTTTAQRFELADLESGAFVVAEPHIAFDDGWDDERVRARMEEIVA
jgi:hypothetical protein